MKHLLFLLSFILLLQNTINGATHLTINTAEEPDTTCEYWKEIANECKEEVRAQQHLIELFANEARQQRMLADSAANLAMQQRKIDHETALEVSHQRALADSAANIAVYQQQLYKEQAQIVQDLKVKLSKYEAKIRELEDIIEDLRKKER